MNKSSVKRQRYPYRVFISYAREDADRLLAHVLKDALAELGCIPVSDENLHGGSMFPEEIRKMIGECHLFIPIITNSSVSRPWVNHETGYAMALRIPVLPMATKDQKQMVGMAQPIHMLTISEDAKQVRRELKKHDLQRIVTRHVVPTYAGTEIAASPHERATKLAEYTKEALRLSKESKKDGGDAWKLRQKGAFSSFCLPNKKVPEEGTLLKRSIWRERDGSQPRDRGYYELLLEERRSLQKYVESHGARLIVDPHLFLTGRGVLATLRHLEVLHQFLTGASRSKVEVVMSDDATSNSLTIVGDWFVAESRIPQPKGYRETEFHWHAPTALIAADKFDAEFRTLLKKQGCAGNPGASFDKTLDEITKIAKSLRRQLEENQDALDAVDSFILLQNANRDLVKETISAMINAGYRFESPKKTGSRGIRSHSFHKDKARRD